MKFPALLLSSVVLLAVGCGGSSDKDDGDGGNNNGGNNDCTGDQATGLPGVWLDPNNAGASVFVIDGNDYLTAFSTGDTAGTYISLFGSAGEELSVFSHRDGSNAAVGTDYTMVGDEEPSATYTFTLSDEDQTLTYDAGSLLRADCNDMADLALDDIAGSYVSRTSFAADSDSSLTLTLNIAADGSLTGETSYDAGDGGDPNVTELSGTAGEAGQYLTVSFNWNTTTRNGVLYRNPTSGRLVLNTIGAKAGDDTVEETLSAILTLQ